jgi:glycerol-3-phosphate acyltransferase PlsY
VLTAIILSLIAGYLLGALPFGYLVAKAKGVNIFEVGSRNPGATNVGRALGKGPRNLVFALDALKGAIAVLWPVLLPACAGVEVRSTVQVAGLVGALLGHSFSCFTRFKGGKGVATATGGFLVLMPVPLVIAAAVWAAAFYSLGYVSLASILAVSSLPIGAFLFSAPPIVIGVTTCVAVFVVLRHSSNILRLFKGTEHKYIMKNDEKSPPSDAAH